MEYQGKNTLPVLQYGTSIPLFCSRNEVQYKSGKKLGKIYVLSPFFITFAQLSEKFRQT